MTETPVPTPGYVLRPDDSMGPVALILGGLLAVALAIVAVGTVVLADRKNDDATSAPPQMAVARIDLPADFDGFALAEGNVYDRIKQRFRIGLGIGPGDDLDDLGIFTDGSGRIIAYFGLLFEENPELAARARDEGTSVLVGRTLRSMGVTTPADHRPGPNGGLLRCGATTTGSVCVWANDTMTASMIGTGQTPAELADHALTLRMLSERP